MMLPETVTLICGECGQSLGPPMKLDQGVESERTERVICKCGAEFDLTVAPDEFMIRKAI